MAPEIIYGVNFQGKSADILALGVLLFIMAFGVPPFEEALDEDYVFFFMHRRITFF
jgi:serine/threonine protein kinase